MWACCDACYEDDRITAQHCICVIISGWYTGLDDRLMKIMLIFGWVGSRVRSIPFNAGSTQACGRTQGTTLIDRYWTNNVHAMSNDIL
jgi:hypothetical protein